MRRRELLAGAGSLAASASVSFPTPAIVAGNPTVEDGHRLA